MNISKNSIKQALLASMLAVIAGALFSGCIWVHGGRDHDWHHDHDWDHDHHGDGHPDEHHDHD